MIFTFLHTFVSYTFSKYTYGNMIYDTVRDTSMFRITNSYFCNPTLMTSILFDGVFLSRNASEVVESPQNAYESESSHSSTIPVHKSKEF